MIEIFAGVVLLIIGGCVGMVLEREWLHRCPPPKVLYGVRQMEHKLQPDLSRRERRAKARQKR